MFRRIFTMAVVIALVITGFWGYREHQQKQALLVKAENQYQRAFHDLTTNLDMLQDELGKALAVNTQRQLSPCLSNVWRISHNAQADVGQLPLTLMPFNRTQAFLSDIGEFSYRVAIRDQKKEPLTDKEWQQLQVLYKEAKDIESDLQNLQTDVIEKNLRWMDAELAMSRVKTDNQIVDGFKSMEKKVAGYPEIQSDTLSAIKNRTKPRIQNLPGENVSPEEAARKVAAFLGKTDTTGIVVQKNGQGMPYPAYSVTVNDPNGQKYYLGMTVKGGHVTWIVNERDVKDAVLDLVAAQEKAENWVSQHGYNNLELIKVEQYDNVGVYTFAGKQGDVILYPDTLAVKVALDNGEITGFNGQDYLFHHKQRDLNKPKLSLEEARKYVSQKTQIQETNLALIENDMGKEILTYEFTGVMDDDTYKVYINTDNGDEEKVVKLKEI